MGQFSIFLVLIVLVSFLLVVVIMVQNPKGGGLSSTFGGGGGQQIGGVKKTSDFLDKSTWALATMLLALILLSNFAIGGPGGNTDSKALDEDNTQTSTPASTPATTPQNSSDNTATVGDSLQK